MLGTFVDLIETLKSSKSSRSISSTCSRAALTSASTGFSRSSSCRCLRQRAGVHADAHRHAGRASLVHDLADLVVAADVARVDPDAVRAGVDGLEGERVVEVDVRDHRDRRLHDDPLERPDVLVARDRAAHQIPARLGDRVDLLHGGVEVRGLRLRHRLDRDGRPAADLHPTNVDLLLGGHLRPPSLARRRAPRSRLRTSRGSACASASSSASARRRRAASPRPGA